MVDAAGLVSDLVLGELVVSAPSQDALNAFLERIDGRVVDTFEPVDPGDPTDHLVRVEAPPADARNAARDLTRAEPELGGELRVDSEATLALLALVAREAARDDVRVFPNWIAEGSGIPDGTSLERYPDGKVGHNAFAWPFLNSGGSHDSGVGAAWSALGQKGKLDARVPIMVVDGGFVPNPDFPDRRIIYKGDWGDAGRLNCGKSECPYHGTQVVLAAMGRLDNGWGTAGPAGPVAELIAVGAYRDKWDTFKAAQSAVENWKPRIVNFSLGWQTKLFKIATEDAANRRFKAMVKAGALLVASAGNDGRDVDESVAAAGIRSESVLWLPCESEYVVCVGGMAHDNSFKHAGSNFGSAGGRRSVEIYGPFITVGLTKPEIGFGDGATTRFVGGTSFASPFVAGVAALIKAADPSLSPEEIRDLLRETAHVGGVHFEHVIAKDKQRRVNALAAVAKVLGLTVKPPTVTITGPAAGKQYPIDREFEFEGRALDFSGRRIPITWRSTVDGVLNKTPTKAAVWRESLSPGSHTITATATDVRGVSSSAQIAFTVVDTPPDIGILAPVNGVKRYTTSIVDLIGWSKDPDTHAAVDNDLVRWRVTRNGQTAFEASGHSAQIPAGKLAPGSYIVRFAVHRPGGASASPVVTTEASFTVVAPPPGEIPPVPVIAKPRDGDVFYHQSGYPPPTIQYSGSASDAEDGQVSGLRFRWTAVSELGTKKSLCVGSNFPGAGSGGGFAAQKSCKEFSSNQLGIDAGTVGTTRWTVTLEVADSTGLIDSRSVDVIIEATTG